MNLAHAKVGKNTKSVVVVFANKQLWRQSLN